MTAIIVSTTGDQVSRGPKLVLLQSVSFSSCLQSLDLGMSEVRNPSNDFRVLSRGERVGRVVGTGCVSGVGGPRAVMAQCREEEVDWSGVMGVLMHDNVDAV